MVPHPTLWILLMVFIKETLWPLYFASQQLRGRVYSSSILFPYEISKGFPLKLILIPCHTFNLWMILSLWVNLWLEKLSILWLSCIYLWNIVEISLIIINPIFYFLIPLSHFNEIFPDLVSKRDSFPSKYLGTALLEKFLRNVSWEEILNKLEDQFPSWTHLFITLLRRILLIKFMLNSATLYIIFHLASRLKIIKNIWNLLRDFLWGNEKKSGIL